MSLKSIKDFFQNPSKRNTPSASFLTGFLLGILLILFYSLFHRGFTPSSFSNAIFIWSDSLSISGILLLLITGARLLNRLGGIADWFGYTIYLTRFLLTRETDQSYTNFHDYCILKEHNTSPLWPWTVIGCAIFLAGCILSFLYIYFL